MGRQKKNNSTDEKIPSELYFNLLEKLPTKSLLKFRCVSPSWCSMIDEDQFTSAHFKASQINQQNSNLLVLEPSQKYHKQLCTIRHRDNFRKTSTIDMNDNHISYYEPNGYINGLICMQKCKRGSLFPELLLWNPSIRKALKIPAPPLSMVSEFLYMDCAFGFDPATNDYKIIANLCQFGETSTKNRTMIYTLCTDPWKYVDTSKESHFWHKHSPKIYLNGIVYGIGNEIKDHTITNFAHLMAFDVHTEVLSYIKLPDCGLRFNWETPSKFPINLNQSIAIMEIYRAYVFIWVREESSWTLTHIVRLDFLKQYLYMTTDGDLLFTGKYGGVYSYNLKTQYMKVLAKSYRLSPWFTTIYQESLLFLNGFEGRSTFNFP